MQIPMMKRGNLYHTSGDVNFHIVGGAAAPENPKENTIWVNTTMDITGWLFSATEPEVPEAGMVWFVTGASSIAEFNALKNNCVQVYPLSVNQYDGSAWVSKTAKSYQDGEWADWIYYLINNGVNVEFATRGLALNSSNPGAKVPTVTVTDEYVQLYLNSTSGSYYGGAYYVAEKIDLTNYKTLKVDMETTVLGTASSSVDIWSEFGTYASDNRVAYSSVFTTESSNTTKTERRVVEIDVSTLIGKYFIGIWQLTPPSGYTQNTTKIYSMLLE